MNKPRNIVLLVIGLAILSQYQNANWNIVGELPYAPLSTINDIWYFTFVDFIVITLCYAFMTFAPCAYTKLLLMLSVGKLFDEFTTPYFGFHPGEILFDTIGVILAVTKWRTDDRLRKA